MINTKFDSLKILVKSSRDSSAAALPISGFPPAPNPLVKFLPIKILMCDSTLSKCWQSVLTATHFAPLIPIFMSLLIVLFPAPPHPIILILA